MIISLKTLEIARKITILERDITQSTKPKINAKMRDIKLIAIVEKKAFASKFLLDKIKS